MGVRLILGSRRPPAGPAGWGGSAYGQSLSYTVTLPKDFVEALGWKPGMQLEVVLDTEKKEIRVRAANA